MPLLLIAGAGLVGGLISGVGAWFANVSTPKSAQTVGGGAAGNSQLPWYVTAGLVVVGGVLVFKVAKKYIKV
jgi:hypothetical protein